MLTVTRTRRGVSLAELLVVVVLLGIFATTVTMRFGRTLFAEFGSQAESRKISLSLLHAQRAAITTGDNHFVQFDAVNATNYQIVRKTGGGDLVVDGPHDLSSDVTITASHTDLEFDFEGQALAAYQVDVLGDNRSYRLTVIPISGSVSVVETTP